MKNHVVFLVALIAVGFLPSEAKACSCAESGTVKKEFDRSRNIVIVKVIHVEKAGSNERSGYNRVKWTKLTVQKVYKGELRVGQELVFSQGGGADCIWTFDDSNIGQEFLFYLGTNLNYATTCSRSRSKKWAAADINYLDNYNRERDQTRISGIVSQYFNSAVDEGQIRSEPLSGHIVRVSGNGKSIKARTDENGVYEVYGLLPGRYRIEPEKVKGYLPHYNYTTKGDSTFVSVTNAGQAEMNFSFHIRNSIKGRLFNADGSPLEGVRLNLLPAEGAPRKYFVETAYPAKDGSFEFEDVPAGIYVIAGNPENVVTSDYPYPRFYSSGLGDINTAERITIEAGQNLAGFTIKASRPVDTVVVSGRVLFADSTPVRNHSVKFASGERGIPAKNDPWATTDKSGNFKLTILKGQKGVIYSYLYPNTYTYRNCLVALERAKAKADRDKEGFLLSDRHQVESVENSSGIEIKFPFSLCEH